MFEDGAGGVFLDFPMAGDAGDFAIGGVQPDGVAAALSVEGATVSAKVAFEVRQLHAVASSRAFLRLPGLRD